MLHNVVALEGMDTLHVIPKERWMVNEDKNM